MFAGYYVLQDEQDGDRTTEAGPRGTGAGYAISATAVHNKAETSASVFLLPGTMLIKDAYAQSTWTWRWNWVPAGPNDPAPPTWVKHSVEFSGSVSVDLDATPDSGVFSSADMEYSPGYPVPLSVTMLSDEPRPDPQSVDDTDVAYLAIAPGTVVQTSWITSGSVVFLNVNFANPSAVQSRGDSGMNTIETTAFDIDTVGP